jgi:hypothetical protein
MFIKVLLITLCVQLTICLPVKETSTEKAVPNDHQNDDSAQHNLENIIGESK